MKKMYCIKMNKQSKMSAFVLLMAALLFFAGQPQDARASVAFDTGTFLSGTNEANNYSNVVLGPGDVFYGAWKANDFIKFATFDGTNWVEITNASFTGADSLAQLGSGLDGLADWGSNAMQVDSSGNIHIVFAVSASSGGSNSLRGMAYGKYDATAESWTFEKLFIVQHPSGAYGVGNGQYSIALDASENPHIVFKWSDASSSPSTHYLEYVYYDGSSWNVSGNTNEFDAMNIDQGASGYELFGPDIAFDSNWNLHVAYPKEVDTQNDSDLWYASYNGTAWSTPVEIADTDGTFFPSLAIDSNDNIHVGFSRTFTLGTTKTLYVTDNTSGSFATATIGTMTIAGAPSVFTLGTSLTINSSDFRVFATTFRDGPRSENFAVIFSESSPGTWQQEVIFDDDTVENLQYISTAMLDDNTVMALFHRGDGSGGGRNVRFSTGIPAAAPSTPSGPTAEVSGTAVTVTGSSGNENITVSLVGGRIRISNSGGMTAGAGATQIDANTIELDASPATLGTLVFEGGDGDDNFEVDFSGGNPIGGIAVTYNGGVGGNDIMTLTSLPGAGTFTFVNQNDGSLAFPGINITYTGLEPINVTGALTDVVLDFTGGAETIDITDGTANDNEITVDSTLGETLNIPVPTGSLTINAGTGDDTINISSLDAQYDVALIINGDDDNDVINVDSQITLATNELVNFNAETINLNTGGGIQTDGGSVTLTGTVDHNGNPFTIDTESGDDGNGGAVGLGVLVGDGTSTLTINTSTASGTGGNMTLSQVGSGTAIGTLTLNSTGSVANGVISTSSDIDVSPAIEVLGDLHFGGSVTVNGIGGFAGGVIDFDAATLSATASDIDVTLTTSPSFFGPAGFISLNVADATGGSFIRDLSMTTSVDVSTILNGNLTASGTQTYNNDVTVAADLALTGAEIEFAGGADSVTGAGRTLTLAPPNGESMTIGETADSGAAVLDILDSEILALTDGFARIVLGSSGAGAVTVNTAVFNDPVTLASGSSIADADNSATDLTATSIIFDGPVAPRGTGIGAFTVSGDTAFADNGTFDVDLSGTTPGGPHDQLNVTGSVTLGANITLALDLTAYTSHVAGVITIIDDSTGLTGTFAGLAEGAETNASGANNFIVSYASDTTLTAASPTAISLTSAAAGGNVAYSGLAILAGLVLMTLLGTAVVLRRRVVSPVRKQQ